MYCINCGSALPEDAKFCTQCGRPVERAEVPPGEPDSVAAQEAESGDPGEVVLLTADAAVADSVVADAVAAEAAVEEDVPDTEAETAAKPEQRGRGLVKYWLSLALFLGLMSGTWGAYLVAKHGWDIVPFSEKLGFLPFVQSEQEAGGKQGLYIVQRDAVQEEDKDKTEDSGGPDAEHAEPVADSGDADAVSDLEPDGSGSPESTGAGQTVPAMQAWSGVSDDGAVMTLVAVNERDMLWLSELMDEQGTIFMTKATVMPYRLADGMLELNGQPAGTFSESEGTLIIDTEGLPVFQRTGIDAVPLFGEWNTFDGEHDLYLMFDADNFNGWISRLESPDAVHPVTYRYDPAEARLVLTMVEHENVSLVYRAYVVFDYLILLDATDETPILLKKIQGGA